MPRTVHVDAADATFQGLDALRRNRNRRFRERRFVVEGVRQIDAALAYGWTVEAVVRDRERRLSGWAEAVLAATEDADRYLLAPALMAEFSAKREPSELLLLVRTPADDPARIAFGSPPLLVIADRPARPGNLGTLIRSCDALGADGLAVVGHAADPYDPECVAASLGASFALPVVRFASVEATVPLLERLRDEHGDLQLVATSAAATRSPWEVSFWRPSVLLLGNETDGLSRAWRELAEVAVGIPMAGVASSLNLACAGTALLYEAARQRAGR